MGRRETPPPKTAEILDEIKAMVAEGEKPWTGELVRRTEKSKNAVKEAIDRLVRLGFVSRAPLRPGCKRELRLR